jgi:hypothetical protein
MMSGQDLNIVRIRDLMIKSPTIIDTPAHPLRAPRLTDDTNPVGRTTQEGPDEISNAQRPSPSRNERTHRRRSPIPELSHLGIT